MTVFIIFTTVGADAGPFNLYSNVGGYAIAFEVGITKAQLLAGFPSSNVPLGTNIIRAQSFGVCTNYVDLPLLPAPTSTTTTSTTCAGFEYTMDIYWCGLCTPSGGGSMSNTEPLTVGKWYYDSVINSIITPTSFVGCNPGTNRSILDSTKQDTCAAVICPPTTTTSSTTTPPAYLVNVSNSTGFSNCDGGGVTTYPIALYVEFVPIIFGSVLYYDFDLTLPFAGDGTWYSVSSTLSYRINNIGEVTEIDDCGPPP
jgi:hypothetical protein